MKKILSIIQSIIGLVGFFSFFAVFISIFINKDYAILFFTLFFLLTPISLFLNKFTKDKVLKGSDYVLIFSLLIMGVIGAYFTFLTFQTVTVYEFNLIKQGDTFSGSFRIPEEVSLNDKKHTFYIEIKYEDKSHFKSNPVLLEFSGPNDLFHQNLNLNNNDNDLTIARKSIDHYFVPNNGTYNFVVSNIDSKLNIFSIRVIIREYR